METISIFVTTIINKSLSILFIFNRLEDFTIKVKNYGLIYLQDDWKNEDPISTNQASFWLSNLAQLVNNFILSNKKKNLVDKFEKNNVFEFNLSF